MTDPDTRLMLDFCAGDQAAFTELVRRNQSIVFNLACRYLGDQAESLVDVGDSAVAGSDPGAFLSPVLQCIEGEEAQAGDVGVGRTDPKDAARFPRLTRWWVHSL